MIRVRWDSDSLLDQPVEELATRRGRTTVEAKGELVEVVVEMAVPHGPLVSAHQPAFEQRKHHMHPRQHGFLDCRRHAGGLPEATGTPPAELDQQFADD